MTDAERDEVIDRTAGVTASFLKELIRRAVLQSLDQRADAAADVGGPGAVTVTAEHCSRALDDLLDSAHGVTRSLLGVGVDPADVPAGGSRGGGPRPGLHPGMRTLPGRAGHGWTAYTPLG
jgi:hypothetical protein